MQVHLPVAFDETRGAGMDVPTMLRLLDRILEETRGDACMEPFTHAVETALGVLNDLRSAAQEAMMEVDAERATLRTSGYKGPVGNC